MVARHLAVALLLLPATACGGSSDGDSGDGRSDTTQRELQAKITADAPPRDLTWTYADPPSTWRRIGTQESQGTTQWQVGTTRCGVSLTQPSGVGTAARPTSDDVVDKAVIDLAATVPGTPTPRVLDREDRFLTSHVTGFDGSSRARFAARTVSFGDGIEGYFLGYRDGGFALQLGAVCGQGAYPAQAAEIQRFVGGLAARTTY